jgi:predicted Zn-dependent protease
MDRFGIVNTYPNRLDNSLDLPETSGELNQYMTIWLAAAMNPIVRWSQFPQFYNAKEPLKAQMTIETGNPPVRVFARVCHSESDSEALNPLLETFVSPPDNGYYNLSIPADTTRQCYRNEQDSCYRCNPAKTGLYRTNGTGDIAGRNFQR